MTDNISILEIGRFRYRQVSLHDNSNMIDNGKNKSPNSFAADDDDDDNDIDDKIQSQNTNDDNENEIILNFNDIQQLKSNEFQLKYKLNVNRFLFWLFFDLILKNLACFRETIFVF
jgi:hypothetical protein